MVARARSLAAWAALSCFVSLHPARAQCDFDFGDKLKAWAGGRAALQSRSLAAEDYKSRILNSFILAFQDIDHRVQDINSRLDDVAKRIAAEEAAATGDPVAAAVRRENGSQQSFNDLFAIRSDLETVRSRYKNLLKRPSEYDFDLDGLGNVGRATLLASFQALGNEARETLKARYSFYVQLSVERSQ
jgi:hypothetical protein